MSFHFAPKNGWGMLVYAPGWSLASQFWNYTPPQKVSFLAAKKMKIPHWKFKLFPWSNFFLKIMAFSVFAAKILSRRSRLSRWSRAPSHLPTNSTTPDRLRWWARPSDDDFTVFWGGKLEKHKKKFFFRAQHLVVVVIYTPKEAHSRIFVTGGSVIAWQMLAKKNTVLGAANLNLNL